MKKIKKVVFTLITIMLILFSSNIYAQATSSIAPTDPNKVVAQQTNIQWLEKLGGTLLGVISALGTGLSVIVLAVLGIKYMIGSVEEKAEFKKSMGPYLIGAVVVFGASTILGILYNIATDITK